MHENVFTNEGKRLEVFLPTNIVNIMEKICDKPAKVQKGINNKETDANNQEGTANILRDIMRKVILENLILMWPIEGWRGKKEKTSSGLLCNMLCG